MVKATQRIQDPRVRQGWRASQLVWWMGMFAAIGAPLVLVQSFGNGPGAVESLPQINWLSESGDAEARMHGLSAGVQALAWLPTLVITAALAASAFLLATVLRAVAVGASFSAQVQRNLGLIALVLIAGSGLAFLLDLVAVWQIGAAIGAFEAAAQAAGTDYSVIFVVQPTVYWLPLALGVIAATFRWVIRDGAALEKEAEGVI